MSIPKTIHYCWFGGNPLPEDAVKCINSWKKYCPDYEIIEWNESNFDVSCNLYCEQAYTAKKWAFVSDFARLWIIYNYGGLYFDTDVKVLKPFDKFLHHKCFMGIEKSTLCVNVNSGLGMGAEKGNLIIRALLESYSNIPFMINGEMDITTCTVRNTSVLKKYGYKNTDVFQDLENAVIYPSEFFSPMDMESGIIKKTRNTHSIHLYHLSWTSKQNQERRKKEVKISRRRNIIHNFKTIPNRVFRLVLGEKKYNMIKKKIKHE